MLEHHYVTAISVAGVAITVKGVGGAIAGAADAVGDGVSGLLKPRKRGKHAAGGPQRELAAETDSDESTRLAWETPHPSSPPRGSGA